MKTGSYDYTGKRMLFFFPLWFLGLFFFFFEDSCFIMLCWFLLYNSANQLFIVVQSLSRVRLFATPWTAARQASLSITNSRRSPKPMSIESVMPSSRLILCRPLLLLPQSFPAAGISSKDTYISSLSSLPATPIHPSGSSRSPELSSLSIPSFPLAVSFTRGGVYMSEPLS